VRELVLKQDCWEHKLAPDGSYPACVDTTATINVLDTKTGKKVWEKKQFYELTWFELILWIAQNRDDDEDKTTFFRIEFSPDSRLVMFSRSEKYRFRISFNGVTALQSENAALALDLSTLKTADLGGDLKKVAARPYIFLDSERVLGSPSCKAEDAGVFSFPKGKRTERFTFGAQVIKRTANPDYVVIKPVTNALTGIYDLKRGVIAGGLNKEDGTIWNNLMAYEATDGKLLLREMTYDEAEKKFKSRDVATLEIPVGYIRGLRAAEVSDAFNWLLMSSKSPTTAGPSAISRASRTCRTAWS